MTSVRPRRPRPALPMSIFADRDVVHLVGGEDVRFTLRAGDLAAPLAELLNRCDGRSPLETLLDAIPEAQRARINELIERLYGERILIDGPAEEGFVPPASGYRLAVEGTGPLAERLQSPSTQTGTVNVSILCQQTLDYHAALEFNRRCLRSGSGPWMWVTTGPAQRGYVSPVFVSDAGACLACLLRHFQRLSPAPALYEALMRHGEQGGSFTAAPFPEGGVTVLEQIVRWKLEQLRSPRPASAVFRLHVLELDTMEVGVHRVFRDPVCPDCHDAGLV